MRKLRATTSEGRALPMTGASLLTYLFYPSTNFPLTSAASDSRAATAREVAE